MEDLIRQMLVEMGEDPTREGLERTPHRVAESWKFLTKGYQQKPEDVVLRPCLKVLDEMFFYTNGKATLCCWDVHEKAVIGDVNIQSVQEIWDGYAATCLRALLDDGRRDLIHLCSRCNAYGGFDFGKFESAGD